MLTPNIPSLKTPKSLDEITKFFNNTPKSKINKYIVKPIYGFQPNTRVYDRKEYTSVNDLTSDIISEHGSLAAFFQMQQNESKFVWSTKTQNDTPIFIQKSLTVDEEFICYCIHYEYRTLVKVESTNNSLMTDYFKTKITDLATAIVTLNRLTTTLVTIKIIRSENRLYFVDLSQSMYPLLTGDTTAKDITELAEMLFLSSSE